MDKEKLNKLIPYIGYNAFAKNKSNNIVGKLIGFCENDLYFQNWVHIDDNFDNYKLILFSPDCLTKEIETEYGKEIPLIEMAKVAFPDIKSWWIDTCYAQSDKLYFFFNGSSFVSGSYKAFTIKNQWQLFQYLYSRHIAFNLEPDEYVNVESLEKNPYADINSDI